MAAVDEIFGTVERELVARGSKSERHAVVLRGPDGPVALRRVGGNPLADPELDALVGKRIRARGERSGTTFFMCAWHEE
jgi:hypothetical protein